jgi:peptidoglycan/LPS O-acetylase OafA/YrhL
LGTISYPIYLYHGWGLGLGEWLTGVPHLVRFVAGTVLTVAGAMGSYFIVEQPFLRLKQRFTPSRSTSPLRPPAEARSQLAVM